MATTDNLFQTTQNFLDPQSIQQISSTLGEPSDKVQTGLRTVIPTFMSGLITKGSTSQGAEDIVHMVEGNVYDSEAVIDDIFGEHYHDMTKELSPATGLAPNFLEKLMEVVAPMVLKSLGKTIKEEKMNPENLQNFLMEQQKILKGYVPPGLKADKQIELAVKEAITRGENKKPGPSFKQKRFPYFLILLAFLIAAGLFLWSMYQDRPSVENFKQSISDVHTSSTIKETLTRSIDEFSLFMKAGNRAEVPERFSFKSLQFITGGTDIVSTDNSELDQVAETLQAHPQSIVRIEAYIENTGDPEENLLLSENRAMIVREELMGRGIEASRIRAEGRGPLIGRGQVELVVQKIK